MNCVYFACLTCKNYIDAGGKWCSHHLEHPGIIIRTELISVDSVLQADDYWNGVTLEDENLKWIRRELPQIQSFLEAHRAHKIIYAEASGFLWNNEESDWMDEEVESEYVDKSPRYYVERLGLTEWCEVEAEVGRNGEASAPFWWHQQPKHQQAKQKFESLVKRQRKQRRQKK